MTVPIRFRREADADVREAVAWYRERGLGLADEFLRSLDSCLTAIQRLPENHPVVHRDIRQALLRRFPYGLFYVHEREGMRAMVIGGFDRPIGGRLQQSYQAMTARS